MITPDEFFSKYNNKAVNPDNTYGNQCFDLARLYCREVLNVELPYVRGASDLWNNYQVEHFDRIINIEGPNGNFPIKGDIPIWGTKIGEFGHIDVAVSADLIHFTGFDQNWPAQYYIDKNGNQIGTGVCHFQAHNYFGVLGWLRPKKKEVPIAPPPPPTPVPQPVVPTPTPTPQPIVEEQSNIVVPTPQPEVHITWSDAIPSSTVTSTPTVKVELVKHPNKVSLIRRFINWLLGFS